MTGDRGGVEEIVAKDGEAIAVVAVEAVLGAEPHESFAILRDRVDEVLGKAVVHGEVLEAEWLCLRE